MAHGLGIVGYGQLGRVLGALAQSRGLEVRAYDPAGGMAAGSLAEAVTGAQTVLLAVPVQALPDALRALRPLLSKEQLVADTCSVKLEPVAMMHELLGDAVSWA